MVTDAQDALGVGDDDEVDLVLPEAIVEQGLLDSLGVVDGEEDAAGRLYSWLKRSMASPMVGV